MNMYTITAAIVLGAFSALAQAPTGESYVESTFFDDFDGEALNTDDWLVATWEEHGGQTGPERCFVQDGILHMHFINSSSEGYLSSAIQTRQEFFYGRWEMRAKPSDVAGVLNSFYTIDWDNTADESSGSDGTKQEIDIEFLTKSFDGTSGEVHLALHAEGLSSWDTRPDIQLGFDPSADFHVYGFEITPEYIEWFADDTVLHRYEYSENPIAITAPYVLKLNTWSAERWIGGPPREDVVCDYQIDWIRFTPYVAGRVHKNTARRKEYSPIHIDNNAIIFTPDDGSPAHFTLFDATGRMVLRKNIAATGHKKYRIGLDDKKESTGIHFYTLRTATKSYSGKLVFMR
ncbi:MAG: family 16 glycosylhydrolase [Chitinivibrionales bacterium]